MKLTSTALTPFTDLTLFTIAVIWALNFSVVKSSLAEVDIYSFNSVRFILAASLIWSIITWKSAWLETYFTSGSLLWESILRYPQTLP